MICFSLLFFSVLVSVLSCVYYIRVVRFINFDSCKFPRAQRFPTWFTIIFTASSTFNLFMFFMFDKFSDAAEFAAFSQFI